MLLSCNYGGKPQSINQHELDLKDGAVISFLLVGHAYGGQKPKNSDVAYSLLENINLLNSLKPDYMMLLGDIIQETSPSDIQSLRSFTAQLEFPVFNAPGNHELLNPEKYKAEFGPSFFHFMHDSSLFVVNSQQYRHRKA